jgi:hypothetical protein
MDQGLRAVLEDWDTRSAEIGRQQAVNSSEVVAKVWLVGVDGTNKAVEE